ncbi:MAG: hypothetical protein ABJB02_04950 [Dokdonella sp.]
MIARCRHSAFIATLTLVFLLLPGMAAIAADKMVAKTATGNIADRWVLWPKAGQTAEFEAALKQHAAWRKKAGEPFTWLTYQPVVGSDLTYYVIRSDDHQWKDFDADDAWSKKAKADEAYEQQLGPHVARAEHYFEETDAAHSHWTDSKDYIYSGVTSMRLKPGARGDMMIALDKIQKAVMDEKWPYPYRFAWLMGGDNRLRLIIPMKSYAEMADPNPSVRAMLTKGLGSAEAADSALKQFSGSFEDEQYTVYASRPDLSTQP